MQKPEKTQIPRALHKAAFMLFLICAALPALANAHMGPEASVGPDQGYQDIGQLCWGVSTFYYTNAPPAGEPYYGGVGNPYSMYYDFTVPESGDLTITWVDYDWETSDHKYWYRWPSEIYFQKLPSGVLCSYDVFVQHRGYPMIETCPVNRGDSIRVSGSFVYRLETVSDCIFGSTCLSNYRVTFDFKGDSDTEYSGCEPPSTPPPPPPPPDVTGPVTTTSVPDNCQSPVSVSLSCTDAGSGCDKTYYCWDRDNICTASQEYYSQIWRLTSTGLSYVRYYSTDKAGNTESPVKSNEIMACNPKVELKAPEDYNMRNVSKVSFKWLASGFISNLDCKLHIGALVFSKACSNDAECEYSTIVPDGSYLWNVTCADV